MTATDRPVADQGNPRTALVCSVCGYGVARSAPPERCPMCQQTDLWLSSRRQESSSAQRGVGVG